MGKVNIHLLFVLELIVVLVAVVLMELLQVHVVGEIAVDENVYGVVDVWVWIKLMKVYVLVMILWMTFLVRFARMEELLLKAFY